jgi:hypothetical protein
MTEHLCLRLLCAEQLTDGHACVHLVAVVLLVAPVGVNGELLMQGAVADAAACCCSVADGHPHPHCRSSMGRVVHVSSHAGSRKPPPLAQSQQRHRFDTHHLVKNLVIRLRHVTDGGAAALLQPDAVAVQSATS